MDVLELAKQAETLRLNPFWQFISKEVRRSLAESILATDPTDTAGREALYHEARALDRLEGRITALIADGAIAVRRAQSPN